MARGMTRTTFNRAGLVRILAETVPNANEPSYDFGEKLGQWLDFSDALALFSALNGSTGATSAVHGNPKSANITLQDQLARVRRNLSEAIVNDGVFSAETARVRFPTPLPQASAESASDFSPYHRYYIAHQREMSAAISALRANARKALAAGAPAHQQLAELDATLEKALAVRERNLLATIPMLIAKRFAQRYQEHRDTLAEGASDDPANWVQPGTWLETFCHDTQAVLLAELELRLKPVVGLIAALDDERNKTQVTKQ